MALLIGAGSPPPVGAILFLAGAIALTIGLVAGVGYQVIARSSRDAARYRGPSPLLIFGLQILLANLAIGILTVLGLPDPRSNTVAFAIVGVTLLLGYLTVVSVFVVRTGALSWRDMGGRWDGLSSVLGNIGYGALVMGALWVPVTIFAALLAMLLGTSTVDIVPNTGGPVDLLLTILAAALLAPIGEEVFFRGFAVTAWLRDLGPRSALVRSTIFFAMVHALNVNVEPEAALDGAKQAVLAVVVIVPVGLALGWIFLRRGLVAAIAGHATFNLIGVVLLALAQSLPPAQ